MNMYLIEQKKQKLEEDRKKALKREEEKKLEKIKQKEDLKKVIENVNTNVNKITINFGNSFVNKETERAFDNIMDKNNKEEIKQIQIDDEKLNGNTENNNAREIILIESLENNVRNINSTINEETKIYDSVLDITKKENESEILEEKNKIYEIHDESVNIENEINEEEDNEEIYYSKDKFYNENDYNFQDNNNQNHEDDLLNYDNLRYPDENVHQVENKLQESNCFEEIGKIKINNIELQMKTINKEDTNLEFLKNENLQRIIMNEKEAEQKSSSNGISEDLKSIEESNKELVNPQFTETEFYSKKLSEIEPDKVKYINNSLEFKSNKETGTVDNSQIYKKTVLKQQRKIENKENSISKEQLPNFYQKNFPGIENNIINDNPEFIISKPVKNDDIIENVEEEIIEIIEDKVKGKDEYSKFLMETFSNKEGFQLQLKKEMLRIVSNITNEERDKNKNKKEKNQQALQSYLNSNFDFTGNNPIIKTTDSNYLDSLTMLPSFKNDFTTQNIRNENESSFQINSNQKENIDIEKNKHPENKFIEQNEDLISEFAKNYEESIKSFVENEKYEINVDYLAKNPEEVQRFTFNKSENIEEQHIPQSSELNNISEFDKINNEIQKFIENDEEENLQDELNHKLIVVNNFKNTNEFKEKLRKLEKIKERKEKESRERHSAIKQSNKPKSQLSNPRINYSSKQNQEQIQFKNISSELLQEKQNTSVISNSLNSSNIQKNNIKSNIKQQNTNQEHQNNIQKAPIVIKRIESEKANKNIKQKSVSMVERSNKNKIKASISNVCLAGEVNKTCKEKLISILDNCPCNNYIILFKNKGEISRFDIKAIYTYDITQEKIELLTCLVNSPISISNSMINSFFQYDISHKKFKKLEGVKSLSEIVDAVAF